jgi:cell division septation protein DedD
VGFSAYPLISRMDRTTPQLEPVQTPVQSAGPSTALPAKAEQSPLSPTVIPRAAGAYILQLGSYNTLATTLRAIDIYARKGVEAHWNALDLGEKGVWYRVFTGRYPTIEAARRYQAMEDLPDAQVVYAAWAVTFRPDGSTSELKEFLQTNRIDSYTAPDKDGRQCLFSGAFVSRESAVAMAEQIHQQTGLGVDVMDLDLPVLPFKVSAPEAESGDPS